MVKELTDAYSSVAQPIRNLTASVASRLGRRASRVCNDNNIPIEKVNDPRFGYVGSYPEEILEEVFNEIDI